MRNYTCVWRTVSISISMFPETKTLESSPLLTGDLVLLPLPFRLLRSFFSSTEALAARSLSTLQTFSFLLALTAPRSPFVFAS